ncbi:MAG TPA: phosphopantetheine-binding protein, partial [Pseudomonadales bacterium]|nr:phosphopantetheine-binding protein [Pseudomonadales bacterium]
IYIGGQQVARGYLNRPELTGEKFMANPFSARPDARLYRTGDLARWRADGGIEYLGRNDFQVKIRGFRIELGEIEAKLYACDAISEALVLAKEGVNGEKQIIAYYVPADGAEISPAQIKQQLAHSLADYMLPAAYVKLDSMPLTSNGKIDRRSLPLPDESHFIRSAFEAPQGKIEFALSKIWQRLLDLEKIGRHDNFFEIGGHSLLAAKLMNSIKQEFNLPVPLKMIFEHPTVAELALVIETLQRHGTADMELSPEMEEGEL